MIKSGLKLNICDMILIFFDYFRIKMSTKSGDFGDISDDSRSNSPIHSIKVTIRILLVERKNTKFFNR